LHVPAPRDESTDGFALLQKQLILSQVQILELEDLRDELQATLAARTKVLTELQTLADRTFSEIETTRGARTAAEESLRVTRENCDALQQKIMLLERESNEQAQRLGELQLAADAAQVASTAQAARAGNLEGELHEIRTSLTWRWTAPFRAVARLFR
jgi:hypothetical protein